MSHTKGKWNNNLHDGNVYDDGGLLVASCYTAMKSPVTIKANAKLCAASLDMHEALQLVVDSLALENSGLFDLLKKCKSALEKSGR